MRIGQSNPTVREIRAVRCPFCAAEPGEPCVEDHYPFGVRDHFHKDRGRSVWRNWKRGALARACPVCDAEVGDPCTRLHQHTGERMPYDDHCHGARYAI